MERELLAAGCGLGRSAAQFNHARAAGLGLHMTDWDCASLLAEAFPGALSAGRLAELTGLTTGAVTGVIDRLEASGYVTRTRDELDRRRVMVRILPERLPSIDAVPPRLVSELADLHARYSEAQLALLVDLVKHVSELLRGHARGLRAERPPRRRVR